MTKKTKSYKIRTTKDILNAVNTENVDGFLKDFESWLRTMVILKKVNAPLFNIESSKLTWNDDGDYGRLKEVRIIIKEKI